MVVRVQLPGYVVSWSWTPCHVRCHSVTIISPCGVVVGVRVIVLRAVVVAVIMPCGVVVVMGGIALHGAAPAVIICHILDSLWPHVITIVPLERSGWNTKEEVSRKKERKTYCRR